MPDRAGHHLAVRQRVGIGIGRGTTGTPSRGSSGAGGIRGYNATRITGCPAGTSGTSRGAELLRREQLIVHHEPGYRRPVGNARASTSPRTPPGKLNAAVHPRPWCRRPRSCAPPSQEDTPRRCFARPRVAERPASGTTAAARCAVVLDARQPEPAGLVTRSTGQSGPCCHDIVCGLPRLRQI